MSTGRHASDEGRGFEGHRPDSAQPPQPEAGALAPEQNADGYDASVADDRAAEDRSDRWDANDERRRKDCFAPPQEPCECYCLHCGRVFMSDRIWFQRVIGDPMGLDGFWMCPTPNCDGAGFTFDIFPTDPDHPANDGWVYDDDDEQGGDEEAEGADGAEDAEDSFDSPDDAEAEWDPQESKYKELDEVFGDGAGFDDDIEGEEWKYGLEPGQRPDGHADWAEEARRQREEDERRYDEPDQRPRILDWSNREDRKPRPPGPDDDIPF